MLAERFVLGFRQQLTELVEVYRQQEEPGRRGPCFKAVALALEHQMSAEAVTRETLFDALGAPDLFDGEVGLVYFFDHEQAGLNRHEWFFQLDNGALVCSESSERGAQDRSGFADGSEYYKTPEREAESTDKSPSGQRMWRHRLVGIIILGIGIGLTWIGVWIGGQYGRLATAENVSLSHLPLPWLFMPEVDIQTGDRKNPTVDRADDLANRVMERVVRLCLVGILFIVGGFAALFVSRQHADYHVSTLELLGLFACVGFLVEYPGIFLYPLAFAFVGFAVKGRKAVLPATGVGLLLEPNTWEMRLAPLGVFACLWWLAGVLGRRRSDR